MPETITINSGEYIRELTLSLTNPLDINSSGLGGTVNLSTFLNLTGITAPGNGITQLTGVSGAQLLQTLRFENNNLTKPNLENVVTEVYANQRFITGSTNKNVNFNLTGASMGKIDRLIRLTGVNKYEAELDKLNFNVFYAVNGETDQTWTGAGTNNNFSNTGNWANRASPLDYDALYFGGTTRLGGFNDLTVDTQFNGVTFNSGAGAFNLSGNRFVLTFDGISNNSTAGQTVHNDIVLSGNNRTINCTRGNINLLGTIIGSGSLVKNGTGTLSLSGSTANTYTGLTTVNGGVLMLNKTGGVTAVGGDLTVNNASVTFAANASNQIASTAALVMSGSNSFFNGTAINNGITVTQTLGSVQVTEGAFNAGVLSAWIVTGAASFSRGAMYQGNSAHTASFGSLTLTGMTEIVDSQRNGFHLHGNNSTTQTTVTVGSGGLTLNNSRISLRKGINSGNLGSRLVLNGNVTAAGSGMSAIVEGTIAGGASGIHGTMTVELGSTAGTVTRTITTDQNAPLTIGVSIVNGAATTAGITKTGAGTLTLSDSNSYTGATAISGTGTLVTTRLISGTTGKFSQASFQNTVLTVAFSVAPSIGDTFRLLPGATTNSYSGANMILQGAPGRSATYNSTNSTLTIT